MRKVVFPRQDYFILFASSVPGVNKDDECLRAFNKRFGGKYVHPEERNKVIDQVSFDVAGEHSDICRTRAAKIFDRMGTYISPGCKFIGNDYECDEVLEAFPDVDQLKERYIIVVEEIYKCPELAKKTADKIARLLGGKYKYPVNKYNAEKILGNRAESLDLDIVEEILYIIALSCDKQATYNI